MPEAMSSDSSSIAAVVAALYDTISGPAGTPRDWDRLRSLFHPRARLFRARVASDGSTSMEDMDVEQFIAAANPFFRENGFYEREVFRRVDQFGHMAQVFSTYEASAGPNDSNLLGRGINSIQLWSDDRRWWVVSMLWDDERPGQLIPPAYLP
jgi:hypothetical protein